MTKKITYLDYNATAPMRPEVCALMADMMAHPHNASSVHSYGREGRMIVERARDQIAALVNVAPGQVIFNSGATEGNNTVLRHFQGQRILVSSIEHPAVLHAVAGVEMIPVTRDGIVDLDALEALLKLGETALVSVMIINNETGALQPIEAVSRLTKKYGAMLHCDGVQAAGRIELDIGAMGIDFLTLSAHKIAGPQGVGALILGVCGDTPCLLSGGGQERGARAGTENVPGISGFGLSAELAQRDIEEFQKLAIIRDDLEERLMKISPEIQIHAKNAPRAANTSMFSFPCWSSETLLMAFDLDGICVSTGSACSSGTVKINHVLSAMGVVDEVCGSALRISMGWGTTQDDIERFLESWGRVYARLQTRPRAHA